ncbi:MAG: sigma-70 family RNA polymerase sigma factor [Clostridia bacterium]|nr:sigma-70 family RNA polymerase sigma factor [Clostridia bacterium]
MPIIPKDNPHGIIQAFAPMVFRLAFARTRIRADAEDICQDVMLRLFRKSYTLESEEHLRHWLIRATVQRASDLFRSSWRRRVLVTESVPEIATHDIEDTPLSRALDQLPEKYRVVVHLHYYEDYTTNEIAGILGRKPTTVRTQLVRARELLKTELGSERRQEYV